MKIALNYISNSKGETTAVQMPLNEWKKILGKLEKYEQLIKIKSNLRDAFEQVEDLRKSKKVKPTLKDFLNEL
ncbi:MAG: hypothetical protein K9I36_07080 [Bacteroidia bacterium]|nr:hypothetical protein [Bacteroidia bacterium]MCF8426477.1 hypothetical protein [Bacteroidia bacterium]